MLVDIGWAYRTGCTSKADRNMDREILQEGFLARMVPP